MKITFTLVKKDVFANAQNTFQTCFLEIRKFFTSKIAKSIFNYCILELILANFFVARIITLLFDYFRLIRKRQTEHTELFFR